MNKQLRNAILVALGALTAGTASAKEGGDQYPNGIETWFAGAVPPPGNYFINYLGHYGGDLYNGEGKRVAGTSASAWFNAFRFVKVSNIKVLGGDWAGHVILPVVHQRLNLGGVSASASGLGDLTIDPFIVAWHKGDWHWTVGLDINLPTGRYKSGDPRKSIGANYWSIEPIFAFTWLSQGGWEVSAKLMTTSRAATTTTARPPARRSRNTTPATTSTWTTSSGAASAPGAWACRVTTSSRPATTRSTARWSTQYRTCGRAGAAARCSRPVPA